MGRAALAGNSCHLSAAEAAARGRDGRMRAGAWGVRERGADWSVLNPVRSVRFALLSAAACQVDEEQLGDGLHRKQGSSNPAADVAGAPSPGADVAWGGST